MLGNYKSKVNFVLGLCECEYGVDTRWDVFLNTDYLVVHNKKNGFCLRFDNEP